jgi:hypothetical protein
VKWAHSFDVRDIEGSPDKIGQDPSFPNVCALPSADEVVIEMAQQTEDDTSQERCPGKFEWLTLHALTIYGSRCGSQSKTRCELQKRSI